MPDFAEAQHALIADIAAAGNTAVTKMGTVQSRDTTGPGATVIFDGSTGTAQPVKCFESVVVATGDRVGVARYESEWIITGNYTLRSLADRSLGGSSFTGGTTTLITFVDMPGLPGLSDVMKVRDATLLRISVDLSLRVSSPVGVEVGVRITSLDGVTNSDQALVRRIINSTNSHEELGGWVDTAAVAAGSYAFTMRWRRATGSTEILTVDVNDSVSLRIQEVIA
jgi:hypothetical protein